jgi:hypothetical protein
MPETPDFDEGFDPPDEALYRSYPTWQLEQCRNGFAEERETGRAPTGEARRLPAGYYDTRLALIDRLLLERRGW